MRIVVAVGVLALAAANAAQAGERKSLDWMWNIDNPSVLVAGTRNSAGQELGLFCHPAHDQCYFAVTLGTDCVEGDSFTALVNADLGTSTIGLTCGKELEGEGYGHALVFDDFDTIDDILRKNSRVGFAVAMADGSFKAVRFSLVGANAAMDQMRQVAIQRGADERKTVPAKDEQTF